MRDYSKVSPQFWIGKTGRELKKAGPEAVIVAMYLLTSPHANMLGLYYMPLLYIAHETGLGIEGASKGLARAIEAGFCHYDEASEVVWVVEMAAFQIGDVLHEKDKRTIGVQNEYDALPENPYLAGFYGKYHQAYHMTKPRGVVTENTSPIEAPSKPLGSQEQEQEKEQEQITSQPTNAGAREVAAEQPIDTAQFAMHDDWMPSASFTSLARKAGLQNPDDPSFETTRAEFVLFWKSRPGEKRTQSAWDHALIRRLKTDQSTATAAGGHGTRDSPQAKTKSAHSGFAERDYGDGIRLI